MSHDDALDRFLGRARDPGEPEAAPGPAPGRQQLDNYRLIDKLGEGGVGEVWLAEQSKPMRRKVAVKIVKHGAATEDVLKRFAGEREALTRMSHPGVASVFDAGTTSGGRPFFVFEYVDGLPVTEHCDRHGLTTRQRLELFVRICDGVQHAHQKAIIHRDLKPGNVLVTLQDGRAVPKIIDFGVAKATGPRLTEQTLQTQLGTLLGTPEYMSPEQVSFGTLDVDTRTDVYALGVMLYELLVGALPFDPNELRRSGFDSIIRTIREKEPDRPSVRLAGLGAASRNSARRRQVDSDALRRQLEGDLDWIVMRAMNKDPSQRYASPRELALDIERHLAHEPVVARPPSKAYLARKFVRRHTGGVVTAAAVVLLVLGFAVAMGLQAQRIARVSENLRLEAESKQQVAEFLQDLFAVSDPSEARGDTITARELLDRGAAKIDAIRDTQPVVAAELMTTIGLVYRRLGLFDKAEPILDEALEIRRRVLGAEHPDTLSTSHRLATLYRDQGRYEEAEQLYLANLELRRRVLGDEDPATITSVATLSGLYRMQGRLEPAERFALEALEARRRILGEEHPHTLASMNNLAIVHERLEHYDEAERTYLEAIALQRRVLGDDHPDTLGTISNLCAMYRILERQDEAEPLLLESLATQRRVLGDEHPDTLNAIDHLAVLYGSSGQLDEAEPLFVSNLETRRRVLGNDNPETLGSIGNLAFLYTIQGRYGEAEPLAVEALETKTRILGEGHQETLRSRSNLAELRWKQGRLDSAEHLYAKAIADQRRELGDGHTDTLFSLHNLATLYVEQRRYAEAEPLLLEVLEGRSRIWEDDHPGVSQARDDLSELYERWGKPEPE